MKQNWWKLLIVVVLVVAVGVVLAGKNRDSGEKTPVAAEPSVNAPIDNSVAEQTQEEAEPVTQEPEETVSRTAETENSISRPDAVTVTSAAPKTNGKPKSEAVVKPMVSKPKEPKPVAKTEQPTAAPKKLPRMIELGAEKCIPCKMMKPVIEELEKDYKGKLDVVFIDVWKDNSAAEEYGIESIPTQIFLDENGKEFFRHTGFFSKEDILAKFREQGIDLR